MKLLAVSIISALILLVQAREEDGRIIAAYSTKTAFVLTTSTTTVLYTCNSAFNVALCKKRRYRRYSKAELFVEATDLDSIILGGSLEDESAILNRQDRDVLGNDPEEDEDDDEERDGRIAITVWSTTSSTYTVTSTSINSLTTFSLSYFCTVNGVMLAPACR